MEGLLKVEFVQVHMHCLCTVMYQHSPSPPSLQTGQLKPSTDESHHLFFSRTMDINLQLLYFVDRIHIFLFLEDLSKKIRKAFPINIQGNHGNQTTEEYIKVSLTTANITLHVHPFLILADPHNSELVLRMVSNKKNLQFYFEHNFILLLKRLDSHAACQEVSRRHTMGESKE